MNLKSIRILGIDPGYDRVGIAVIEKAANGKDVLLHSECLTTGAKLDFYERLILIEKRIISVIAEYAPTALAIETLFISKNQKTAMKVAEARGIIALAAARHGLSIHEYTPLQIKMAVTGDGKSDKAQIEKMVCLLVDIGGRRLDDEYDAIAAALTVSGNMRDIIHRKALLQK